MLLSYFALFIISIKVDKQNCMASYRLVDKNRVAYCMDQFIGDGKKDMQWADWLIEMG